MVSTAVMEFAHGQKVFTTLFDLNLLLFVCPKFSQKKKKKIKNYLVQGTGKLDVRPCGSALR